jgi:hypothetical protein
MVQSEHSLQLAGFKAACIHFEENTGSQSIENNCENST